MVLMVGSAEARVAVESLGERFGFTVCDQSLDWRNPH